jgi:hypothetical protein
MTPAVGPGPTGGRSGPRLPHVIGSADPAALSSLAAELAHDPEVTVRRQEGPVGQPRLLLVDMTPDHADLLRRKYPHVTIEFDAPLEPYT